MAFRYAVIRSKLNGGDGYRGIVVPAGRAGMDQTPTYVQPYRHSRPVSPPLRKGWPAVRSYGGRPPANPPAQVARAPRRNRSWQTAGLVV